MNESEWKVNRLVFVVENITKEIEMVRGYFKAHIYCKQPFATEENCLSYN